MVLLEGVESLQHMLEFFLFDGSSLWPQQLDALRRYQHSIQPHRAGIPYNTHVALPDGRTVSWGRRGTAWSRAFGADMRRMRVDELVWQVCSSSIWKCHRNPDMERG